MATKSFNTVPTIHAPRSRFDMSFSHKTSANVGTLYPCYIQEIYPGDVFDCSASIVTRLSSAYIRPVMDDLYLDMYFFFVPSRLVFEKWQQIFGDNRVSAWSQFTPVAAPTWSYNSGLDVGIVTGSVADHLGLPIADFSSGEYLPDGINILPFRCFAMCYDDWFRDENIVAPMNIEKGAHVPVVEYFNAGAWSASNYTGMCPKVAKFHDYFTSCLPGPQKGQTVGIPLSVNGQFLPLDRGELSTFASGAGAINLIPNTDLAEGTLSNLGLIKPSGGSSGLYYSGSTSTGGSPDSFKASNLGVNLPSFANASINDLRYAFQLQKILERSARAGTRYTEYLLSAFGVKSPDARLQRPEYLGGKRMPLSVQQVAQTSRTDSEPNALGSLGAFSLSNGKCGYSKGFVEHGFVLGMFCIRQRHVYQQGIEKFWSRSERFSYYDPCFANIGEQPVYKDEIFGIHSSAADKINGTPFGYQEAWADLRYRPNVVTGMMHSNSDPSKTLDIWHFADNYANAPTLNKQWIEETPEYVDRTIAVKSTSMDQFILDIYYKNIGTRRLPTWSIPSLIDHN